MSDIDRAREFIDKANSCRDPEVGIGYLIMAIEALCDEMDAAK